MLTCLHRSRVRNALLVGAVALGYGGGCEDFETPAELLKPTVIAVVSTPPITKPGETSALQVVLVDPSGPVTPSATTWELRPTYTGYDVIGAIEPGPTGTATYTAPAAVPPLPDDALPVDTLQIRVTSGDTVIDVVKLVGIANLEVSNPTVELLADDTTVAGDELVVARGTPIKLAFRETPLAGDDARYAWYSTLGIIEDYQSNPAELLLDADETRTEGWLHGVYRDGLGGVAWRSVRLTVAP